MYDCLMTVTCVKRRIKKLRVDTHRSVWTGLNRLTADREVKEIKCEKLLYSSFGKQNSFDLT